jgi:RNA polymerase II subunit A small phosphatase-like protein
VAVYPSPTPATAIPGPGPPSPCVTVTADYGDGSAGPVDVFVRPGLQAFLARLAALPIDVVLFTAGLPGYAGPIADALDPSGALLPTRLFRPSTRAVGAVPHTKDLTVLGRDLARTVLLDNSPWSFLLQPGCGVPAAPFAGRGGDAHLVCSVLPLLEGLAADPALDVRPALGERFGMAAWLAARGGWALFEGPCGTLHVAAEAAADAQVAAGGGGGGGGLGGGGGGAALGADGPESGRQPAPSLVAVEA